ncbi:MAG TPA: methyltransferase domain-containing protein, partial [Arachidicoccus sp.]
TNALACILEEGSIIYAVDKALQRFSEYIGNNVSIHFLQVDFVNENLPYSNLDGILMANSLHYVSDKNSFIKKAERCLSAEKRFIIVEYDTMQANQWVPYPLDFTCLKKLFKVLGYKSIEKLEQLPSTLGKVNIYAALVQ